MPAVLVKGHIFSAGDEVNAAALHDLIGQSTMSGLDRSNFNLDNFAPVSQVNNWNELEQLEPGVEDESFWLITKLTDDSPASMIAQGRAFTLDSGASNVLSGELLAPVSVDASGHMTCTNQNTTDRWKCCGVAVSRAVPGGKGVMITHGIVRLDTDGTGQSVGDSLAPSSTATGKAVAEDAVHGPLKIGSVISTHGVASWAILFK